MPEIGEIRVRIYQLRLKGVKKSQIESTEPLELASESDESDPADGPSKRRNGSSEPSTRRLIVRERGPNNDKLTTNQVALVSPDDLEKCEEPFTTKEFACVDGVFIHAGHPDDSSIVFGDVLWILGALDPSSNNSSIRVVSRSKKEFIIRDLDSVLWTPREYSKHNGEYCTRAGGQLPKKDSRAKVKYCNIIQKNHYLDTDITTTKQYGEKRVVEELRLDDQVKFLNDRLKRIALRRSMMLLQAEPARPPTQPEPMITTTTKSKGDPRTWCNLGDQCPFLIWSEDGKTFHLKASMERIPSYSDPYPKHHHLLDAECPQVRSGMPHYPHCAYAPNDHSNCILRSPNFQHSCCSPDLPPGTELRDEPLVVTIPALPGNISELPAEVEPRGVEPRDYGVYQDPQVQGLQTKVANAQQDNAMLRRERDYWLYLASQRNHQLPQGTVSTTSSDPGASMPATTQYGVGGPSVHPHPYQSGMQVGRSHPVPQAVYQRPVPGGYLPGNEHLILTWMPENYEADGLPARRHNIPAP